MFGECSFGLFIDQFLFLEDLQRTAQEEDKALFLYLHRIAVRKAEEQLHNSFGILKDRIKLLLEQHLDGQFL